MMAPTRLVSYGGRVTDAAARDAQMRRLLADATAVLDHHTSRASASRTVLELATALYTLAAEWVIDEATASAAWTREKQ